MKQEDKDFAESIGATHYIDYESMLLGTEFFKIIGGKLNIYCGGDHWARSPSKYWYDIEPIDFGNSEKGNMWEKVEGDIFDLKEEFSNGELYYNQESGGDYCKISTTRVLAEKLEYNNVYRKVDWCKAAVDFIEKECEVLNKFYRIQVIFQDKDVKKDVAKLIKYLHPLVENEGD